MYHGDQATITALTQTMDFRVRQRIPMTPVEQQHMVSFLKSLTDPTARDLSSIVPAVVPSGLPIRE
jgi:hypothetical protein